MGILNGRINKMAQEGIVILLICSLKFTTALTTKKWLGKINMT